MPELKNMDEEVVKTVNNETKAKSAENRRMEIYMQITALATSMIVLAILSLLLYYIRSAVAMVALAFLGSYIVSPAVRFFEKRGLNRLLIVSLFYIAFVATVVVSAVIFLPVLWNELGTLQTSIQFSLSDPDFETNLLAKIREFEESFPILKNLNLQFNIDRVVSGTASWILNYIGQLARAITTYSGKIIWLAVALFLIPFITFFLLKDGGVIKRSAIKIIPARYSETTLDLLQTIDRQIGRFIRGKIAESIILSILTIIGLRILGIKYYLVIGSIAGFANLIPYIGAAGIAIPPILLALYQYGLFHAVMTGVFLGGLQVVDNMILVPMIVGKSVDLHPIVTIFVVFVGGQTLGLLGMIAAVPLTSILISVFQAVYKEFRNFSTTGTGC